MSYHKELKAHLYVDIETEPDMQRLNVIPVDKPSKPVPQPASLGTDRFVGRTVAEVEADCRETVYYPEFISLCVETERAGKNRSGVIKALESNGSKLSDYENQKASYNKTLSVTPEYNRILAIGYVMGDEQDITVLTATTPEEEAEALRQFWDAWRQAICLVGYNVRGFDAVCLTVRSMLLGVEIPRRIDFNRYRGDCLDLMDVRFGQLGSRAMKLKDLAALYGLDVKCPGVDGSQISDMSLDEIRAYCASDVDVTRQLHNLFLGYFC